jgi:hypothetical protein
MAVDVEDETVLRDSALVELTYQQAIDGTGDDDDQGDEGNAAQAEDTMEWVDDYIYNTRRKGGQQTEASVLKLYNVSTLSGWL